MYDLQINMIHRFGNGSESELILYEGENDIETNPITGETNEYFRRDLIKERFNIIGDIMPILEIEILEQGKTIMRNEGYDL